MRSNPAPQYRLISQLENILRSYLNFSTSYGRSTDLKSLLELLFVTYIWPWEKISLKYFHIGGGRLSPHVQTVLTSLLSKLVNIGFIFVNHNTYRFRIPWFLSELVKNGGVYRIKEVLFYHFDLFSQVAKIGALET